jgi:UDP-N-acetylmuramyl pentapeptide phosphotransferase/UDP-N-acetylglucosamine-1-phosphate transferase
VRLAYVAGERACRSVSYRLLRTNYRGRQVSLLGGPAIAVTTVVAAALDRRAEPNVRRAAVLAGGTAAVAGWVDDTRGSSSSRGFLGHLSALRHGTVTTGVIKIGLIGAGALGASRQLEHLSATDGGGAAPNGRLDAMTTRIAAGAVIAASANLANLLDLRPGRALKVALVLAARLALSGRPASGVAAVTAGCAAGMLPLDLGEQVMLGDTGANCVGAMLGVAAVAGARRRKVFGLLAGLAVLTAASEVVSFSRVIEGNGALSWIDQLGRRAGAGDA